MKRHDELIGTLLHEVAHLIRLEIDRRVREFDLTRVKWLALETIEYRPQLTQTELARELGLGPATVGRLVDRLERRKLVERVADEQDRRACRLLVTEKAAALLGELDDVAGKLRTEILDGLHSKEISSIESGLGKLRRNLRKRLAVTASFMLALQASELSEVAAIAWLGMTI